MESINVHGHMTRSDLKDPDIYFDFWYSPELAEKHGVSEKEIERVSSMGGTRNIEHIFHRMDGPASIGGDGKEQWFLMGEEYETKEKWEKALKKVLKDVDNEN